MDIRQIILLNLAVAIGVQSRPGMKEVCSQAADIVFVLDSSTSIWIEDFKQQLTFVQDVVKMFDVGQGPTQARVGIITFGNKVWIDYTLDKFSKVESLLDAVEKIPHKAGTTTNTWEALDTLTTQMFTPEMGSRLNVSHIAIVITDGRSQKTLRTKVAAEAVHHAGINMFAIGVGHNIDFVELGYIASDPDEEFLFKVDNYNALESIKEIIADKTCQVTQKPVVLPSTTPTTKSQSDQDAVVTVTHMHPILQTTASLSKPQGDQDPNVTNCRSKPADVYFVIDSSASIGDNNFRHVLNFVKDIASIFNIGKDNIRVGLLTFSHDVQDEIPLDNTFTKDELLKIIVDVKYTVGGTNTGKALEFVRTVGFSKELARPGVAHVAIVVTDGMSKNPIETARQAELAHKAGIYTFAIGVGEYADLQELRDIASNPDKDFVYQTNDFSSLDSIKKLLAMRTCDIKPNDKPVDRNDDTDKYVCTPAVETDLLFAYDSVAIGSWKSQTVSQFIASLVNRFDRNGLVRVGMVTSDCQRSGNIALTQELSNVAFSRLEFTTYTHLIRKVRRHGFSVEQGGRPEAKRIAVMVVDEELEDVNSEMISEAQKLNKEAEVYVVVVGKGNNLPLVHELVMVKGVADQDHIIYVDSFQNIFPVKGELLGRLCKSMSFNEIIPDPTEVNNNDDYDYASIPKPV